MRLLLAIWSISQKEECRDGFTIEIPSLRVVKKGWAVAYEATQNSFGIGGLDKAIDHALKHDQILGGWFDDGKFYFDSIRIIHDEAEAIKFGREQKQIAIYEIHTGKLIRL